LQKIAILHIFMHLTQSLSTVSSMAHSVLVMVATAFTSCIQLNR